MTELAIVWPASKFRFDASGGAVPHGKTVAYPGATGSITVTLSTMLVVSVAIEARFTTGRVVTAAAEMLPPPLSAPSMVDRFGRVSSTRTGYMGWKVVLSGK